MKALVVEDIELNQLLMKTLLDEFGYEHDIADNGLQAIRLLEKNHYDIVLMDLQMPEMNGFEATQHIRSKMKSSIPILALTADVTPEEIQKCKAAGMNDYIGKPIDEKLLYVKMNKLLNRFVSPEETMSLLSSGTQPGNTAAPGKEHCTNLAYLNQRSKDNPALMKQMIGLYLKQTPALLQGMKESVSKKDWDGLYTTVHKMIPSFWMMGINSDYEYMAKTIQEYAYKKEHLDSIPALLDKVDHVCRQACNELEEQLELLENK